MKNVLLSFRIVITLASFVPLSFLLFGIALGGAISELSPEDREPSDVSNFLGGFYIITTILCSFGAIWIRSRILLASVSILLVPVFIICGALNLIALSFWPCLLFPFLWLGFFCVAWPHYATSPTKTSNMPRFTWHPEDY
jgi:hypothetical protein